MTVVVGGADFHRQRERDTRLPGGVELAPLGAGHVGENGRLRDFLFRIPVRVAPLRNGLERHNVTPVHELSLLRRDIGVRER